MANEEKKGGDRSISVGGNVEGSALVAGDQNTVSVSYQRTELPPPAEVDVQAELSALRQAVSQLTGLEDRVQARIENALSEAEDEAAQEQPDKDEVGRALERALEYAQKADGFGRIVESITPHVKGAAAWLGSNWHKLLSVVGLTV